MGVFGLEFRVLGPLEVRADGVAAPTGGPRQRALLALLLLSANRVVSRDRLIEELMLNRPGENAARALTVQVSRLRKVLASIDGSEPRLLASAPGYVLRVMPGELDLDTFERLLAEGRSALERGDPARAAAALREGEALWRGRPLADLEFEPFARPEVERLEGLRLAAMVERIEAELELGRHGALLPELEALVAEHPLQERLREQLMLALYRSGRQADALDVYQEFRRGLSKQLGLEPGPALRRLQQSILNQSVSLEPPARTRATRSGNLPSPPSSFIGRSRELTEVSALLQRARLLTLTGAGGSGKTRLALQVADACAARFRDGAWFVEFADIIDPELIAPTICQTLGLAEHPDEGAVVRVERWLKERDLLLVLDNLEQLEAGTATLSRLLRSAPGVRMILTSRELLKLTGEHRYRVPPLEPAEAVQLFLARAQAVAPGLTVDPEIAAAICDRLDRIPLAIELAATQTDALAPHELLARLGQSLTVPLTGPRDAPPRQRTLRATLDWSYNLLPGEPRELFTRLSVFAGGCTRAAAEAVCDADLESTQALVDRSLVVWNGERFAMLQTIREYALERMEGQPYADEVHRAHARWLVELLEVEGLAQPGWPSETSLPHVAAERDNFRAALKWTFENSAIETTARLAAPLVGVWVMTGQLHEATEWMNRVLAHVDDYPERLAAQVLSAARALAWHKGRHAQAAALSERALTRWQALGEPEAIGKEMLSGGLAAAGLGDDTRGKDAFLSAAQFARDHGLSQVLAAALNDLGDLAIREGRLETARALCEESRNIATCGSVSVDAAVVNLAHIEMIEGRSDEAARLAAQALTAAMGRGDLMTAAWAAVELSWPLAEQGELERSARLLGSGLEFLQQSGARREWMDESCQASVLTILRAQFEQDTAQRLIEEGRRTPIEQAANDAIMPITVADRHE